MRNRGRIIRAYKRLGLDRCPCEAEAARAIVVMPEDTAPSIDYCPRCGRASVLLIEIVYVPNPPPGWFLAEHPGIATEAAQQQWQEYLDEFERQFSNSSGRATAHKAFNDTRPSGPPGGIDARVSLTIPPGRF